MKKIVAFFICLSLFTYTFSADTEEVVYDDNGDISTISTYDDNGELTKRKYYKDKYVYKTASYVDEVVSEISYFKSNGFEYQRNIYTSGLLLNVYEYTSSQKIKTTYDAKKYITHYDEYDNAWRNTYSCSYVANSNTKSTCITRQYKGGKLYRYLKTYKGKTTEKKYYESNGKLLNSSTYSNGKITNTYNYKNGKLSGRHFYTNGYVTKKYLYVNNHVDRTYVYTSKTTYNTTRNKKNIKTIVKYHFQKNNVKTGQTIRTYKNGTLQKIDAKTYVTYYSQYKNPHLACNGSNINSWGCFMTSFAMQYSAYSNKELTPAQMYREGVRCFTNMQTYGRRKGLRTTKVKPVTSGSNYLARFYNTNQAVPNGKSTFTLSEAIVNYGMPIQLWMRANSHIASGFPGHSTLAYRVVIQNGTTAIYAHDPGIQGRNINLKKYMAGGYGEYWAKTYIISQAYAGGVK